MSEQAKTDAIKLDYQLILDIYYKGIEGGFNTDIVEMTIEAVRTYYDGYRRTPIITSGEVLHRLNCEFILQFVKAYGEIQYYKTRKKRLVDLKSSEISGDYKAAEQLTNDLTLCDTIYLIESKGIFHNNVILEMHALRNIRNSAVHKILLPRLNPYSPPGSMSRETIEEIIRSSIRDDRLPLKYRQHVFPIEIDGKSVEYIVDQEKLGIEVENVEPKRWMPTIALALLFSIMQEINQKLPIKT